MPYRMTDSTDSQIPAEPHEGIDAFANDDARAYEQNQSSPLARASGRGAEPTDAPVAGQAPEASGTRAGDVLAGVELDPDVETVDGDDGPEHPGVRRSS